MQTLPTWKKYEDYISGQFKAYYPSCTIQPDHKVTGRFSKTPRQIDISIRTKVESFELFGVVDCKCYRRKVDLKVVESILGFMEDVGADFGYIITNEGFTKSAQRRIEGQSLLLRVIAFSGLNKELFTVDELINNKIQLLDCVPPVFLIRQQERSAFVNLRATSLDAKVLTFEEGFVETRYFAHKKLLEETARVFRDFPSIGQIKVAIPIATERQTYSSKIGLAELQQFLQVDFLRLRADITSWRSFLSTIDKPLVKRFAAKYVHAEPSTVEGK